MWNQESCKEAYDKFVEKENNLPRNYHFSSAFHLPSYSIFVREVGITPLEYGKQRYPQLFNNSVQRFKGAKIWSTSTCLSAYDSFVERTGKVPRHNDMTAKNGLPSASSFYRITGMACEQYGRKKYPDLFCNYNGRRKRTNWNRKACIKAVKDYVSAHQELPKNIMFSPEYNLPTPTTFKKLTGMTPKAYMMREFGGSFSTPAQKAHTFLSLKISADKCRKVMKTLAKVANLQDEDSILLNMEVNDGQLENIKITPVVIRGEIINENHIESKRAEEIGIAISL